MTVAENVNTVETLQNTLALVDDATSKYIINFK